MIAFIYDLCIIQTESCWYAPHKLTYFFMVFFGSLRYVPGFQLTDENIYHIFFAIFKNEKYITFFIIYNKMNSIRQYEYTQETFFKKHSRYQ